MTYESPFRPIGHDDIEADDPLCLSITHELHPTKELIGSYFQAATYASEQGLGQVAWFAAHHLAELGLKLVITDVRKQTPSMLRGGHDLAVLLKQANVANLHPPEGVVDFINDLHQYDVSGIGGRYATSRRGDATLAEVCCADPVLFNGYVADMWEFFDIFAPIPANI